MNGRRKKPQKAATVPKDVAKRSIKGERQDRELYDLWRSFSQVRRAIWKTSAKELGKYGITPEQAGVLYIVRNVIPNGSQSQISRLMLMEHHTISGIVQRMEARGLVKREVDGARKNVFRVTITEKGEEAYRYAVKRRSVHNVMLSLTAKERQQFSVMLNKLLAAALNELEQYYTSPFS